MMKQALICFQRILSIVSIEKKFAITVTCVHSSLIIPLLNSLYLKDPDNKTSRLLTVATKIQIYRNSAHTMSQSDRDALSKDINDMIQKLIVECPQSLFFKYLMARLLLTRENFDGVCGKHLEHLLFGS